jgi:hypothetical protein
MIRIASAARRRVETRSGFSVMDLVVPMAA